MQPCLLILGMHRSGTSALADAVKLLGAELGSDLMPAEKEQNEKGFFEHLQIHELHRLLLLDLGRSWHDLRRLSPEELTKDRTRGFRARLREVLERDFGDSPLWCVKDPRLCRLLPVWLEVLKDLGRSPHCMFISRHPREVADSLARRDGFSLERSAFLWVDHNLAAERASRDIPRVFLTFPSLLRDPVSCLSTIGEQLGLSWPVAPADAASELREGLSPRLRHHRAGRGAEMYELGRLGSVPRELHRALRAANLADGRAQQQQFERIGKAFDEVYGALDPLLLEQAFQSAPRRGELSEVQRMLEERTRWLRLQAEELQELRQQLAREEQRLSGLAEHLDSYSLEQQRSLEVSERWTAEIGDLKKNILELGSHTGLLERGLEDSRRVLDEMPSPDRLRERFDAILGQLDPVREQIRTLQASQDDQVRGLAERLQEGATVLESHAAILGEIRRAQRRTGSGLAGLRSDLDQRTEALQADWAERLQDLANHLDEMIETQRVSTGSGLAGLRSDLDQRTEAFQADWAERLQGLTDQLDEVIERQRVSNRELLETSAWQGESLIELRRDLEATTAAEQARLTALAGRLENAEESLSRSRSLAEMLWASKPWRVYLWVGRVRATLSRRLSSLVTRLRPRRHQVQPVEQRAPAPAAEPAAHSEFRALIIDHRLPTPDKDSGSLRMSNLITVLQELGFELTFLAGDLIPLEPYARNLRDVGVQVVTGPEVSSITQHLEAQGREYSLVIVCRLPVALECIDQVRALCPAAKVIFDTVDLYHLRKERRAELEGSQNLFNQARRYKEQELSIAGAADATWVVSSYEQGLLAQEVPELRVDVVSNIHVIHGRRAGFEDRRDILFIGGFEHEPNADAVEWLVREILPLAHDVLPDLHLLIVGSKPTKKVLRLASDQVTVTGYVADVEPYFTRCRLSVAPLRFGAGIKGKVNQSMAYGVPCIVTAMAAEGMDLTDRVDAMIADSAADFARRVVEAYRDPELWLTLSEGGLENVRRLFSFEVAREAVARSLDSIGHRRAIERSESAA